MAELHEKLAKRGPLTNDELRDLERLATVSTGRPWKVEREPLKVTEAGVKQGCKGIGFFETTIHTAWDHPQAKGPAPVVTTAFGPFYEPNRAVYIREEDAAFIVAACNATHRLIAEVRSAREAKRKARRAPKVAPSRRHGMEAPGHEDGCRCRECDPSR